MAGWVEQIERKASLLEEQMRAAAALVARFGQAGDDPVSPYMTMLREIYREEMPVARLLDNSDLILHAEGPSLRDAKPGLKAVNWICTTAERQIRLLATSIIDMASTDLRRAARMLDLRLSGLAPGSLYAGFRLEQPDTGMFEEEDRELFDQIRMAIHSVARVPAFIEDERVSAGLSEAITDPATRDAAMEAAYRLSPTGRLGIHTVDVSAPDVGVGSLSQRERVVLKAALVNPVRTNLRGVFVGEAREVDMDANRIHLRNIEGIGALRCVVPPMTRDEAKIFIGSLVRVEGTYDTDKEGRPRLLRAEHISAIRRPVQTNIDI